MQEGTDFEVTVTGQDGMPIMVADIHQLLLMLVFHGREHFQVDEAIICIKKRGQVVECAQFEKYPEDEQ